MNKKKEILHSITFKHIFLRNKKHFYFLIFVGDQTRSKDFMQQSIEEIKSFYVFILLHKIHKEHRKQNPKLWSFSYFSAVQNSFIKHKNFQGFGILINIFTYLFKSFKSEKLCFRLISSKINCQSVSGNYKYHRDFSGTSVISLFPWTYY